MKNSVYLETLRLGYENSSNGISFNDIVKELNIDLSDNSFYGNYVFWFYSNFFNKLNETPCVMEDRITSSHYDDYLINSEKVKRFNAEKSYIKGDAINKYIDFVELQDARKSSRIATRISLISVAIAIVSIIVSALHPKNPKPPYEVIITNDRNNPANGKLNHSIDCKFGINEKDKMNNNQTNNSDILHTINPK